MLSPVVSDYDVELALASQELLACQPSDEKSDNRKDLWQEGQHQPLLRQGQLRLHEEEHRQLLLILDSVNQEINPNNQNSIIAPKQPPINIVNRTENVWDLLEWDDRDRPLAVRTWGEFKFKHGFEHAFQPLRGTHATRYAKAVKKREESLKETKDLCWAVTRLSNEQREGPTEDHQFVAEGLKEIERYENFRAVCPSKHDIEVPFTRVHVEGEEVIVKWIILDSEPFMGYQPGDYLVRVVEWEGKDYLVTEGVVPYAPEEYIDRLVGDVVPAILSMVIAIVAFDPLDVNKMPQWCTDLRNKSVLALTAHDMEKVHNMWESRFMDFQTLPSVLEFQCWESESKFCEAAWLSRELEKLGVVYPWSEGFEQLLQEATGEFVCNLAWRYTNKFLHLEALECIMNDEKDRVLAYQIPPFAQKAVSLVLSSSFAFTYTFKGWRLGQ